ncbi:hypothetical protein BGZ76_011725, partial [Entomortierella beljakovae]
EWREESPDLPDWEIFPVAPARVIIDLTAEKEPVLQRIKSMVDFMSQLGLDVQQLEVLERMDCCIGEGHGPDVKIK